MPRLEKVKKSVILCFFIVHSLTVYECSGNSGETSEVSGHDPKGSWKTFFGPNGTPQKAQKRRKESSSTNQDLLESHEAALVKYITIFNEKAHLKQNKESKNVLKRFYSALEVYPEIFPANLKPELKLTSVKEFRRHRHHGLLHLREIRPKKYSRRIETLQRHQFYRLFQSSKVSTKLKNPKNHYYNNRITKQGVVLKTGSPRRNQNEENLEVRSTGQDEAHQDRGKRKNLPIQSVKQEKWQANSTSYTYQDNTNIFSKRRKRNAPGSMDAQNLRTIDSHISDIISGLHVNYCACLGGYARTLNGCVPVNASVTIVDGSRYSPMTIESSLVRGSRREVECIAGKAAVSLPHHSFALLPGGYLIVIPLGLYFTHDHYCMEHVQTQRGKSSASVSSNNILVYSDAHEKNGLRPYTDRDGTGEGEVQWRAKVCLKHPLKVCNKSQQRLSKFTNPELHVPNNKQNENQIAGVDHEVPTLLGKDTVKWSYSELPFSLLTCLPGSSLQRKAINSKNYLSYSREGTVFSWNVKNNLYINFNHDEFCIEKGSENPENYVALFCNLEPQLKEHDSSSQLLVLHRKCCPVFQIFNTATHACEGSTIEGSWIQKIYSSATTIDNPKPVQSREELITEKRIKEQALKTPPVAWGFPECSWQHSEYNANDFRLQEDKGLVVNNTPVYWPYFCFETFRNDSTPTLVESVVYCLQSENEDEENNFLSWDEILTISLMSLSCVFMSLTLITYVCVPGVSDRIAGGCVVSEVASLLASFVLVIVAYLPHGLHGSVPCIIIGTISHAVTLASFFWLNIICYDVHSTIRGTAMENRRFDIRRYLAYCCWGWGAPCLIAVAGAAVDGSPSELGLYRPHTALACFPSRKDSRSQWLYVYGPIAVLLSVNLGLFVHLSCTIVRTTRQAMAMAKVSCDVDCAAAMRKRYKRRVKAYCKLFLVMGLSWIAEVLSFQFRSHWIWIVTDSFNALRGVFIFFIFVYKPETWNKVKQTTSQKWRAIRRRCSCSLGRKVSTATAETPGVSTHSSGTASLSVLSSPHTPRVRRAARADAL